MVVADNLEVRLNPMSFIVTGLFLVSCYGGVFYEFCLWVKVKMRLFVKVPKQKLNILFSGVENYYPLLAFKTHSVYT